MLSWNEINKTFEIKRKKILSVAVALLVLFLGGLGYFEIKSEGKFLWGVWVFVSFVWFVIFNVLKKGFQKEIEDVFIKNSSEIVVGAKIDIECGIDENVLVLAKNLGAFKGAESFNALVGDGYKISEELLYNKMFGLDAFRVAVFEGVMIELEKVGKDFFAKIKLADGKVVGGEMLEVGVKESVVKLMKIFGAKEAVLEVIEDKGYVFMNKSFLNYQFEVLNKVELMKNVSKLRLVAECVNELKDMALKNNLV